MDIYKSLVASQKAFFRTGATLDVKWRKDRLRDFLRAVEKWEQPLLDALWTDLHKSKEEAYLTEIGLVKAEIKQALSHVSHWARKEWHPTPLSCMPANSWIVKEPLGTALIMAPWNYPVQLLLNPLVGAIAAGCTAVLKPSPYVPTVAEVLDKMIKDCFDERYIAIVQGHRDVNQKLLECRWDIIFYTGSPAVAHDVMAAAAKNLTPLVLELGGKSPCIVDKHADIELAARRIVWGKTINSGQTCIAPDYLLIHKDVRSEFVSAFARQMTKLHGADVKTDRHYVRMVSDKAFRRVSSYLEEGTVLYGGRCDASERFIEPTLLGNISAEAAVMNEEIFGPILPVIEFGGSDAEFMDKVTDYIVSREKPLAFYYFGDKKAAWETIRRTSSGGGCINDTIMHIVNGNIPFGGVGNSGMGHYHHKESFAAFSHKRSIVSSSRIDLPFKYMPYGLFKIVKHLL